MLNPFTSSTQLTASEVSFVQNISGLTYAQGDILYYNGSVITNLGHGVDGQLLKTQGAGANPVWSTVAGTGDVAKVGTPANNQVGVWTGDGTIEGDTALTFDTTTNTLTLAGVADTSILAVGGSNILVDSPRGTMTLSNIDAIDATTETTLEAALDFLKDVVDDLTPQLGGNLDVNGKIITSASGGNIVIDPNGAGEIELGANVGIGTSNPDELLHLYKGTGEFTTMKLASAATSGYMFAYDGDNSVNIGSSSDSQVNFKQNNTTQGYIGADGNWVIKRGEGDDTILEIVAPTSDPQEATVVTKLDLGSGNAEWIDWTIENYGTDHKASINVSKSGTGTILPFVIRTWNSDLGDVATHGQEYFTITPLSEVVINESSNDVNFRVEGNGDANTLFVDAGNDRVGVGMNNPAQKLDVTGNIGLSGNIELGHASDTTIARVSAGVISVEGVNVLLSGGALGTPSSGTLTNCTGLPVNGIVDDTASALGIGTLELGHASDTTFARVSAGVASIEGNNIVTANMAASAANINTGTSTTVFNTPDALAGSYAGTKSLSVQIYEGTTDVAIGDGKAYITIPESLNGMNLVRAQATVVTAGTTNATTVMIHNKTDAQDMLSGAISIASAGTVGTVGTVNASYDDVATNDVLRIDIDSVSTTAPKGMCVVLEFQLP